MFPPWLVACSLNKTWKCWHAEGYEGNTVVLPDPLFWDGGGCVGVFPLVQEIWLFWFIFEMCSKITPRYPVSWLTGSVIKSFLSKHFLPYEKSPCLPPYCTDYLAFHIRRVLCLGSCCEINISLQVILYKCPSKGKIKNGCSLFSFKINFTYLSIKYLILSISLFCIVQNSDFYL